MGIKRVVTIMNDDVSGLNAICEIEYDDATMRVTALHMANPTSRAIAATLIKTENGRVYATEFPAGFTTFISIPQTPTADRIDVTLDAQGRLVGTEFRFRWVV